MCVDILAFFLQLDKQPLFFKEVNPQPRKHTQWRSTTDFTDGEASTHRFYFTSSLYTLLICESFIVSYHFTRGRKMGGQAGMGNRSKRVVLKRVCLVPSR